MTEVTLAAIEQAARELSDVAITTAMEETRWLSSIEQGPVRLKCENLQRTGSFKIRGAFIRLSRLSASERARGVVAASAGNHAQGVALAASMLGISATVFMPIGAPIPKYNATLGYGATVHLEGADLTQTLAAAMAYAERTGAVFIHPFDHADVIVGQGTVGLEILAQAPDVATVLVPTGGGGLLAGVAVAIKSQRPDVKVIGVQAQAAAAWPESISQGHPVQLQAMATLADGIAVAQPGDLCFEQVQRYVDDIVTVSDDLIARASVQLMERAKMVVEPAGATGVAALLDHSQRFATPTVCVLSGGNIDPLLIGKMIRQGMAASGRYLHLRVRIPDVPGGLAGWLAELATTGANVLEVSHDRTSNSLRVGEVDVS
ncbi:MAG TPA: threonine ammonia-lyase, partial [Marmoricola sp.]|nr:threonine ammonia-lyase [Marmoricola sp.]